MKQKFDFALSDGTKGTIDKSEVTISEWRAYWRATTSDEENDKLLAKVSGLAVDVVSHLLLDDYKRLSEAFRKKCLEPLSDPKNSESAST